METIISQINADMFSSFIPAIIVLWASIMALLLESNHKEAE